MLSVDVSIVVPAYDEASSIRTTLDELSSWLDGTGLGWEIIVVDDGSGDGTAAVVREFARTRPEVTVLVQEKNQGKGAAVRTGVHHSRGEVIAFIDADLPYQMRNLGDAIALVRSGAADIVIGARDLPSSESDPSYPIVRKLSGRIFSLFVQNFLIPDIPDTQCGLKAFSRSAASMLFTESTLDSFGFDFEILFLAKKYGYRIERIAVGMSHRHESKVRIARDSFRMLRDLIRVRMNDRRRIYRRPHRCPVCMTASVKTRTQIGQHVVRECSRCRCRFLAEFPSEEELLKLYQDDYFSSDDSLRRGYSTPLSDLAEQRTNKARLKILRRYIPPRARLLEVGAGTGSFGMVAGKSHQYVGIDLSREAVSEGRSRGLDLVVSGLGRFVNTGPLFDGICLFQVLEHLPNPHHALASLHSLLKPGGALFLITPDTESLLCAISGDRWVSYKFPEHLILYSRSALIELLENSGFEVLLVSADYEHHDRDFIRSRAETLGPVLGGMFRGLTTLMPRVLPINSGSVRVVARRRAGPPFEARLVRSVEPTHAR
ncbi:MAG: glycosyltransferase [Acidobacteria bacterium]|nr:glycosyltransferase [Acidobacteriota bacterium]